MKANEAPEKIYLTKNLLDELHGDWNALPSEVFTNIEYTRTDVLINIRTDVLIEKACEWLNNFYSEDRHCYLVKEDIDAFRKAMEERK